MWSAYTRQRNRVTKEIIYYIQDYYKGLIEKNKGVPKKMWKTINRVLDKDIKSTTVSSIEIDGKILKKQRVVLEMLNNHFLSVGPKLSSSIEARPNDNCLQHITQVNNEMMFRIAFKMYVLDAINQLKNGKASGPDNVSVTLVKDAKGFIANPLMLIYNSSLENGAFPDIWKLTRVSPIYKSGPKNELNNYRPISVISVFQNC